MTTLAPSAFATAVFPASADVEAIIRLALAEDVGRGDLTTEATVSAEAQATADLLQKAPGVLCGLPVVAAVFARLEGRDPLQPERSRGSPFKPAGLAVIDPQHRARQLLQRLERLHLRAKTMSEKPLLLD